MLGPKDLNKLNLFQILTPLLLLLLLTTAYPDCNMNTIASWQTLPHDLQQCTVPACKSKRSWVVSSIRLEFA